MSPIPGGKIDILVEPDLRGFPGKLQSGLQASTGVATSIGRGLGLALGVGLVGAGAAFKEIISITADFQTSLNTLQAVTGATGDQMAAAGAKAKELGSDITLPGTSAATAAEAMTELAKGGLSVEQSMAAAKGTLTLAAAAQIDGARAAQIQSDALNIFGLAAEQAGHVADVLANSANSSAVEITDVADSMKFVGPVAKAMGISLEDTATAVALLGNAGIRGSEAGTSLRGMLASLVAPSGAAGKAIRTLGLETRDSQGNFVGFESIIDQLRGAQGRLTDAQFQGAVATAFGRETMSGVLALVNSAPGSWDKMSDAVTRQGGAQEVAAAKMQGLGGALEGFQSQLETTAITIGMGLSPALEGFVRTATDVLGAATDLGSSVGTLGDKFPGLNTAVDAGKALWQDFTTILGNAKDAAQPVIDGIGRITESVGSGGGALATFSTGLGLVGDAAAGASSLLGPVGTVVGGLFTLFSELPGPAQSAALAFAGFKLVSSYLDSASGSTSRLASAVNAVKPDGLRQFNAEARVQRDLAAGAGESISRWGGYQAAFETSTLRSVSALRNFRDQTVAIRDGAAASGQSISTFSAAIGTLAERSSALGSAASAFQSTRDRVRELGSGVDEAGGRFSGFVSKAQGAAAGIAGIGAAGGSLVKSGLGGLIGALGGPWGLAIGAGVAAISLLADSHARAEEAARKQSAKEQELAGTLDKVTGSATAASRELVAQSITNTKLSDGTTTLAAALTKAGISATDFVDATTGNQPKLEQLNATLHAQAKAALENSTAWGQNYQEFNRAGVSLDLATDAALGNVAAQDEMARKLDAVGLGWRGLQDKVTGAIGPLGEVGRLLGNQAGTFADAQKATEAAGAATQDFGKILSALGENKAFDTIKAGGQANELTAKSFSALGQSAARTAEQLGQSAAKYGTIDTGAAKARESMEASRKSFVDTATQAGLTAAQADALANQIGLIPAAAETIFRTNATGVAAEFITLGAQIAAVPGAKQIVVDALSDAAQQKLRDLGFTVTTLPNGQVQVDVHDEAGRARLEQFVAFGNGQITLIKIDGDPNPATGKINATVQLGNGQTATMTYDARPDPATGKINATVDLGNGKTATMTLDALPDPATGKINGVVSYGNGKTTTVTVVARDNASSTIDNIARNRTAVITVITEGANSPRTVRGTQSPNLAAKGAIFSAMHDGGLLGMANGGRVGVKLKPMTGGVAQVVPPNTWRVIGDRITDDEAFIPINRSRRSQQIFEETARRMGYTVARRFAEGGVAGGSFRDTLGSVIRARVATSGASPDVVAAIGNLQRAVGSLQTRMVTFHNEFNVPDFRDTAAEVVRRQRNQAAMGLFG